MGSGITAPGSGITSHGHRDQQFLRDQAVPLLRDQGPKFVALLESRIRYLAGYKNGISDEEKTYLVTGDPTVWIFSTGGIVKYYHSNENESYCISSSNFPCYCQIIQS